MASEYHKLFNKIRMDGLATIVLQSQDHLNRIRAGLSIERKKHLELGVFTGDRSLESKQFRYEPDTSRPEVYRISLEDIPAAPFTMILDSPEVP